MRSLLDLFRVRAPHDRVLLALCVSVLGLMLLAIFFAGAAMVLRIRNTRVERRWLRLEAAWEDAVLGVLTGDLVPSALPPPVRRADALRFIDFLARFARRVRGPERERLAELAAPYLPLVAERATHRFAAIRARSVQTLALLGLAEYAPIIVRALADRSEMVAMTAARALARRDQPQFAEAVLGSLRRFTRCDRRLLVGMVETIGPRAAAPLIQTLGDSREPPRVRAIAADVLRALNRFEAGDTAAMIAGSAPDRELLFAVLRLLARIGRPEHLPAVRGLVQSPDPVVRAQAANTLGALEVPAELSTLVEPLLADPSPWVARAAARALRFAPGMAALRRLAASDLPRSVLAREVLADHAP